MALQTPSRFDKIEGDLSILLFGQGFRFIESFEYDGVSLTDSDDVADFELYDKRRQIHGDVLYLLCVFRYTFHDTPPKTDDQFTSDSDLSSVPPDSPAQSPTRSSKSKRRRKRKHSGSGATASVVDKNMNQELLDFYEASKDGEVTIVVDGFSFQAHRVFLVARSEYFRALFRSGMEEALTNRIVIEDLDPCIFEKVLRFIYSGIVPENILEVALLLLPPADRFGLRGLREACESAVARYVNLENAVKLLLHAHTFSCATLKERCLAEIRENPVVLKNMADSVWPELKEARNHEVTYLLLKSFHDCTCKDDI